jgi:hypothetical protein
MSTQDNSGNDQGSNQGGEFWSKGVEKKQRDAAKQSQPNDPATRSKKRRSLLGRALLLGGGVLLLIVVALVVLAPNIAGAFAPGIAQSQASNFINGTLKVDAANLSWSGPQKIGPVIVNDKDGKQVAKLRAEISGGLVGFLTGGLDLGTVTISNPSFNVVRHADGTTNIQQLIKEVKQTASPSTTPATTTSKPASSGLPAGLKAKLVVKSLEATFTDEMASNSAGAASVVALSNVEVNASLEQGKPLTFELTGGAASGSLAKGAASPTLTPSGTMDVKARIEKWSKASGEIDVAGANADISVAFKGFPVGVLDALVSQTPAAKGAATGPQRSTFVQALGPTLDLNLKALGTLEQAALDFQAQLQHAHASANLKIDKGILSAGGDTKVWIEGSAIAGLVPAASTALRASDAAVVDAIPNVQVTVQNLKVPMPKDGAPSDYRTVAATLYVAMSDMTGKVKLTEGQPMEAFTVSGLGVQLDAPELGKGAHLTASSKATIGGKPAGDLMADITATGIVGTNGQPGMPSGILGQLALKGIATAIAQPFVQAMKLNLPEDLGPTLDVEVKAASNTSGTTGGTPPTDIDLMVKSQYLKVTGGVSVSDTKIATRDSGLIIEAARGGRMAQRLVGPETGWSVSPGDGNGSVTINVRGLNVPRDAKGLVLEKAAGVVELAAGQLLVQPIAKSVGGPSSPLDLRRTELFAELKPGAIARATLKGQMNYANAPFTADGAFDITNVFADNPATIRPIGTLELKDVPTALASMFIAPPAPKADGSPAMDLQQLMADALGQTVNVAVQSVAEKDNRLGGTVSVLAARAKAGIAVALADTQADIKSVSIETSLTPDSFARIIRQLAPDQTLRLTTASTVRVDVAPISIPLTNGKPDFAKSSPASVHLTVPGKALFAGLMKDASGAPLPSTMGVEGFDIKLNAPLAALTGPAAGDQKRVSATITGGIIGTAGEGTPERKLLAINTRADAQLSEAKPAGPATLKVALSEIDNRALEEALGRPGLISGAIGSSSSLDLDATMTPGPGAFDAANATIDASAKIAAQRLQSDGPINITVQPDRIALTSPAKFRFDLLPEFLNGLLVKPPAPGTKAQPAAITLKEPAAVSIALNKFVLPRGQGVEKPGGALLAPPPLQADLNVSIPNMTLADANGQVVKLAGTSFEVRGDEVTAGKPINFNLAVAKAAVGNAKPVDNIGAQGFIVNLVDAHGGVTTDRALLNATCDLPAVPTLLIDTLSGQKGLLVDALGDVIALNARVEQFPIGDLKNVPKGVTPVLKAQANSPRATAAISGTVQNGAFVTDRPIDIKVTELTQAMSNRFLEGLPLFGSLEKKPEDQPCNMISTTLSVPLDNDMTKLNGELKIDPGEARFGTSSVFGEILKFAGQKTTGTVGQRLEPLMIRMERGIVRYDRWKIPLGQFTLETEGTIDLVNRTIDVTTFAPFGALADGAAGKLNTGLGAALGKLPGLEPLTMIPIRTRGSLDNPKTAIDPESIAKEAIKNLSPDNILKKGLEDGLKDLFKPKGKP